MRILITLLIQKYIKKNSGKEKQNIQYFILIEVMESGLNCAYNTCLIAVGLTAVSINSGIQYGIDLSGR